MKYVIHYGPGQVFVAGFEVGNGNGEGVKGKWANAESVDYALEFSLEPEAQAVAGLLRVIDPMYGGFADDRDIFKVLAASEAAKL